MFYWKIRSTCNIHVKQHPGPEFHFWFFYGCFAKHGVIAFITEWLGDRQFIEFDWLKSIMKASRFSI